MYFGKNVSFMASNFQIVQGYMNRTRRNFSATLNIIIEQWDEFSLMIQKMKDQKHLENISKAKVVKEQPKIEVKK